MNFKKILVAATLLAASALGFAANNVTTSPYTFTSAQTTTFLNTATISNTLTQASSPANNLVTLTGTFTASPAIGELAVVTGFDISANNGTFTVTGGNGSTTLIVYNPSGASDTHAATVVQYPQVPNVGPFQIDRVVWKAPVNVGDSVTIVDNYGETIFAHSASSLDVARGYYTIDFFPPQGSAVVSDFQVTAVSSGTVYVYTTPLIPFVTVTTAGTAVSTGTCQLQTAASVPGMTTNQKVAWSIPTVLPATWQTGIQVVPLALDNQIIVELCNPTAGSITPAAQTISLGVPTF